MKACVKTSGILSLYSIVSLGAILFFGASVAPAQQGHTLIAHYTFDNDNGYSQPDSSGNYNDINGGSSWANSGNPAFSTNAIAGGGALFLDGGEDVGPSSPPGNQTFDNWLAMFYGSFSVSLWINTTNIVGNDSDSIGCCNGATIIDAYNNGTDDTIPIGLTGSKVAFFTGDSTGNNGDTLHSTTSVTTGSYVHIVVTRDQSSGRKTIYVNGVLDSSDTATTDHLDGDITGYNIGGFVFSSYTGLLDDVQFYSGVLDSNEVAFLYRNPGTTVTNVTGPSSGLVAYYDFDENTDVAADLTANGNNLIYGGHFSGPVLSSNSISGSGAVYFNSGSFLTPSSNLLSTFAGNFSLSLWLKTTQNTAWDTAPAYYGAGIVSADVPSTTNDLIPMALTGGAIGFNTGSPTADDTVNSATDINDGNYHYIVVTRNQATGEKRIFIDGIFSTNDFAGTGLLTAPQLITIGALADASQSDPTSPEFTGHNGFVGLIDDIQVYSRVLATNEVAFLHAHPGSNATNNLVAHYDFDEGTVLATDVSGHGNNIVFAGAMKYGALGAAITNNSISGAGALSFDGTAYQVPQGNLVSTLAGNFSLSAWLLTTQSLGSAGQPAYDGAGIVTAEGSGHDHDLIPLALTGGKVAFETDGNSIDTLTSTTSINNGQYHHVVVTRNQATGQKQIYIDGALNTSDTADPALLNNPQIVVFGALADASQADPNSPSLDATNGYAGLMDNVQIYSRVISATEVTYLYNNPGLTIPVSASNDFGSALGASNLVWTSSGDASWFVENTNTYSTNAAAAQSGSLQDNQSSILQTTVTGPGTLSFYWQTIANGDDFDLEFDVDGNYQDDISGQTSWALDTFQITGSGTHTLTWNANTLANYGSSPTDAGFLDQVVFISATAPVITMNPFSQTNYPGYPVALAAAASGTPDPTWQWYEVGNPDPIPGATSALYIPGNSGSSNVAGSYYAVASNLAGSQTTATAVVTFVTAPLPPDWSAAFKSPFSNFPPNGSKLTANDLYHACLVDSTGTNIYSVGYTQGTNYFGTNEITSAPGQYTAIIVKQTTAGPGLWVLAVTNNGNGNSYGEAIAPAPSGGVYVVVGFSGTNWFGNTMLVDSGAGSILLARLDANGNTVWSQTVSATTNGAFPFFDCLVADPSGNVTLTGVLNGSATIGGSNVVIGAQTSFLAQFNSAGTLNWVEHVQNIIQYLQYGGGRLYVSLLNWLSGDTNYTVGGLTNDMALNYTLAAINATNGQGIWLRDVGEAKGVVPFYLIDDYPQIAVSGTNVFLVGTAYGSNAVFGSFTVPLTNGRGQYFARYDTNGNAQLATGFGSATTTPYGVVADADGNVYVAGDFDTYADFGNDILAAPRLGTLSQGYFGQAFAAKFDRTGTAQWARLVESTNLTVYTTEQVNFYGIALAPNGIWVCGEGNGTAYFGTNLVNSSSETFYIGDSLYAEFLDSGMLGMIALTEPLSPVTLINPVLVGTNLQFSFVSTPNHTNYVQYSTNLAKTNWLPYSTIVGDGTTKMVVVPANHPASEFFRVDTQ